MLKALIPAALLAAGLTVPAAALPVAPIEPATPGVIQVYGGCGIFGHRGPYGGCRHGGQAGGYIPFHSCPRGFHIGFGGRHCFRN